MEEEEAKAVMELVPAELTELVQALARAYVLMFVVMMAVIGVVLYGYAKTQARVFESRLSRNAELWEKVLTMEEERRCQTKFL